MNIVIIKVFKRVDSAACIGDVEYNSIIVIPNRDKTRFEDFQKNRIEKRLKRKKVWRVIFTILKYMVELFIALIPLLVE